MRTPREIRADLAAVDDEIEGLDARSLGGLITAREYLTKLDEINERRHRLQAELAEARAAEELTPSMFEEVRA